MGLKKEMIQKRVHLLGNIVHELHQSEKGNWWGIPYSEVVGNKRKVLMNERSLRKGNFFKDYGSYREIPEGNTIFMVTKSGGIKIKTAKSNRFQNMTRKSTMSLNYHLSSQAQDLWFNNYKKRNGEVPEQSFHYHVRKFFYKGKKNEWVLDRLDCDGFEFFRSFSSLKEAKIFLGYDFLGDDEFYEFLGDSRKICLIFYAAVLEKSDRVALVHHFREKRVEYLVDMWNMLMGSRESGAELDNFSIPANHEKLREIHDDLTFEFNKSKALTYNNEEIFYESPLFEVFDKNNLKYEIINSERSLYLTGCKSHHCIASRNTSMNTDLFVTFFWEGESYDCQFKHNKVYEFRGYKNKNRPDELYRIVSNALSTIAAKPQFCNENNENNISLWKISKNKEELKKMKYPPIGQKTPKWDVVARNRAGLIEQVLPF